MTVKKSKEEIENFYRTDQFLRVNPKTDADSFWKAEKLKPFIDDFLQRNSERNLKILDVGGGVGIVMKNICDYISGKHKNKISQFAIDLSPGALKLQQKYNPDLKNIKVESIEQTSFKDKEIDLTLLIDVIEHVHDPMKAFREISRISKFVLIKVPLEKNISVNILNMLSGYRNKRMSAESVGHINFYSFKSIKKEINNSLGEIISSDYMNVFHYLLHSDRTESLSIPRKIYCFLGQICYGISPSITSLIFNDFAVFLIKTY